MRKCDLCGGEASTVFKDKEKIRIDDVININGEIFKVEDYE